MKIKENIQKIINEQINHELYSAYMYLSMAAYLESINFRGFAHWMKKQAEEEKGHAMKFFNYIYERGGNVTLTAIEAPKTSWKSPLEAFEEAYRHEQKVTSLIYGINTAASEEKDYATFSFNKWFVDEQVEEESHADEIVQKLKLAGDHKGALLMIDRELGSRQ